MAVTKSSSCNKTPRPSVLLMYCCFFRSSTSSTGSGSGALSGRALPPLPYTGCFLTQPDDVLVNHSSPEIQLACVGKHPLALRSVLAGQRAVGWVAYPNTNLKKKGQTPKLEQPQAQALTQILQEVACTTVLCCMRGMGGVGVRGRRERLLGERIKRRK